MSDRIGEGSKGFVGLHAATSLWLPKRSGSHGIQSVNRNRNGCGNCRTINSRCQSSDPSNEQAAYERTVIFDMIKTLEQVKEQGYSDWQTLTSFIANLLLDQDNPRKLLKQLTDDVKLKVNLMRDMRRRETH